MQYGFVEIIIKGKAIDSHKIFQERIFNSNDVA
jgi:hypothetical protein